MIDEFYYIVYLILVKYTESAEYNGWHVPDLH